MKINKYCSCGAAMEMEAPEKDALKVLEIFNSVHIGKGHRDCSREFANKRRIQQED